MLLKKFKNNEVTITKAAEIANLPLTIFMDVLSEKKISFHHTLKELEEEFEKIKRK